MLPFSPGAWEDVQQETFLRMFRKINRWRAEGDFCQWVLAIATNAAYDQARVEQRRKRIPMDSDAPDAVVDPKTPPLSNAVWKCIDRTAEQLPENLRLTYELHLKQEMTVKQTAACLGKAERTIQYWLKELWERFQSCLD
jgi:RNA polymerase sigma-70 factor (ECF subfamily)